MNNKLNSKSELKLNDRPWWNYSPRFIPATGLASLGSALMKMRQNELMLTSRELAIYIRWYILFDCLSLDELSNSVTDTDLSLLISIEEKMKLNRTSLTRNELSAYSRWYERFGIQAASNC